MGFFDEFGIDELRTDPNYEVKEFLGEFIKDVPDISTKQSDLGIDIIKTDLGIDGGKQVLYPNWVFNVTFGQAHGKNVGELRTLAKAAWCQMPVNTFKKRIFSAEWDIVPEDPDDDTDYSAYIDIAKERLRNINTHGDSINKLCMESMSDLATIDAGVWNLVYTTESYDIGAMQFRDNNGKVLGEKPSLVLKPFGQRELAMVNTADGATVLKQVDRFKNLLAYWQYSFANPYGNPLYLERDEIVYMMLNPQPDSIYGFAPVESIQIIIEMMIEATRYNKDLYKNNAVPDILISLGKTPKEQLERIKRKWYQKYQGKPHQVGFINWDINKIEKLSTNQKEMDWLEGLRWFYKVPFGIFNVSPAACGFYEDSGSLNSDNEGKDDSTVRYAIQPYMKLFEDNISNRLLPEIWQQKLPLKFKFILTDRSLEKAEFERDKAEMELGALTINDYRRKTGREPYEWGDEPLRRPFNPETSFMNFADRQVNPRPNNQEPDDGSSSKISPLPKYPKKSSDITSEEVVSQASDYSSFLLEMFDGFETKVVSAIDKLHVEKGYTDKTFGDFLRDMFNVVNTKWFVKEVKRFLRADMEKGIVSAETELDVDIGFTPAFNKKLAQLHSQQIDGYTINGKKWFGIKGVTKEIQHKVISAVQEGINLKKSIDDMKKDVKEVFSGFSEWRSEMISRTETNRVVNESKLLGYKESKIDGKKVWMASIDNRTSDICKRLNGQTVDLDDDFTDPSTMKRFHTPPGHPSCRSVLVFEPK